MRWMGSDIWMSSAREDQTVVNIRCAEWVGKPDRDHTPATVSRNAAESGGVSLCVELIVGRTALDTIFSHAQTPPVPPSHRTEQEVPEALEKIILKCLEKEPENRPQSAAEMASLLEYCPLKDKWGPRQASEWWKLHLAI